MPADAEQIRAELIGALSAAISQEKILELGSRLLRAQSEAVATALVVEARQPLQLERWLPSRPGGLSEASLELILRRSASAGESQSRHNLPGVGDIRVSRAVAEDRTVCYALEVWPRGKQFEPGSIFSW